MRIVLDPPTMQDVATRFVDAAADVEGLSLKVAAAPQPELPAGFGDLPGMLTSIARVLEIQSKELLQEAAELRKRVAVAQLGTAIQYALRDPRYKHLSGEKLKKALDEDPKVHAALLALAQADNITSLVASSRKWQRLKQIEAARHAWNVLVRPNSVLYGDESYRTFRGYMQWQERMSHSMSLDLAHRSIDVARGSRAEAKLAEETGPLAKLGKAGDALELGGKSLAVLDVVLGGYTVIHGSEYGGTRGDIDRGVAGMSVLAGATVVAAAFLPIPVAGEAAAAVILTGAALWTAGNMIADHRKEIAHAVTSGGSFLVHHPLVLAGPAGVGAQEVWDHRADIEHAGESVVHAGSSAVHAVGDAGGSAVHAVGKAVSWRPW
jgi:hypothetical protein